MIIAGVPLVLGVAQQARQQHSGIPLAMVAYAVLAGLGATLVAGMFGLL